jgi:16S rRNA C967 or C1407 C5-methylase (RsmB/RsmF family)/NOL1/NOP2/fmu family ribosome biogenesis protein
VELPADFIENLHLPPGEQHEFLSSLKQTPPVSIRLNPLKAKLSESLEPVAWSKNAFYMDERPRFTSDPAFHAGAYYPQEASSMFLEQFIHQLKLNAKPLRVLDLCASPGGKSTHLRSLLHPESLLVSNEVIPSRVPTLIENLTKWGVPGFVVTQNDPIDFQKLEGFFDLVLVDAPCSGEGLFRKQLSASTEWSLQNVDLCSSRQRRILNDAWPVLKQDGILIYSTCTYNPRENEENIDVFIRSNEARTIEIDSSDFTGVEVVEMGACVGYRFMPHRTKGEGFFISALRKTQKAKSQKYKAGKSLAPSSAAFIHYPGGSVVKDKKDDLYLVLSDHVSDIEIIHSQLNVKCLGMQIGKEIRQKMVPDHGFAMLRMSDAPFEVIELSLENALLYLQKNDVRGDFGLNGLVLVSFEGFRLGFARAEKHRLISKYPKNQRVLKGLPGSYVSIVQSAGPQS